MSETLERAIALLTDGHPVDWESLLEEAADPHERKLLEELRGLAQLDDVAWPGHEGASDAAAPRVSPSAGRFPHWGHLEVRDEIGRGAYGIVYHAWDTTLARQVALKLMPDSDDAVTIAEARRLARVVHRGVVSVYGADRIDGQVGLWMELLKGRTLDAMLTDQGPFSERETVGIGIEICGAVAAIHAAQLVHRDIKAQNVMREPGGRLVLMDMGASVDVSSEDMNVTTLTGTPLYMAPELFEGLPATKASDVYAIGVLLYRLVTAAYPIQGHTIREVRRAHASGTLRPLRDIRPDLGSSFVQVVERCLHAEPAKRFASAAALERALHDVEKNAGWPGLRRAWLLTSAGVTGLALAALVAVIVFRTAGTRLGNTDPTQSRTVSVTAEQYKLFAGYEDLAFSKRGVDPSATVAAIDDAIALIRPPITGNNPVVALLRARQSTAWRDAGESSRAATEALNATTHTLLSVGEEHPYSAVIAMEMARNAQAAGDHRQAAEQVSRALEIRWRVLGLSRLFKREKPLVDVATLERLSRSVSAAVDSDGDGLVDLVEAAAGLDPKRSGTAPVFDDEREAVGVPISNRLAIGLGADPFLTWAHYGAFDPRFLGWQTPARFPMAERAEAGTQLPAWSMSVPHSQGYFFLRFTREQAVQAMTSGFSLLLRVRPIKGVALAAVNLGPVGPRFEVAVRPLRDNAVEVSLLSSLIPRAGSSVVVETSGTQSPLLEMRYRSEWKSARLFVDGRLVSSGYLGHRQFQEPNDGGVLWTIMSNGGGDSSASAAFNLVWLEFFGRRS